ncbi:class I SAM-dependent methyltransferase [Thaumasiovibrio sp. DFM-14]|uniref:class I SAM-dependent methyltransferase n=1 Tax=Thaumasiovibrio sp. DFM-14 TaxID=3384792 RepID=UPI00399F337F
MDTVKAHFEEEAQEFDEIILKLIPHYLEMIDSMISSIPFDRSKPINVIDLGCGTGTISLKVKEAFPNAKIKCLDLAEKMIEMSKLKLQAFDGIRYEVGNFDTFQFQDRYDVVVSSLALHHIVSDNDKIHFYQKIYDALLPSGIFLNADVVLASSDTLQSTYLSKWKSFMLQSVSSDEIDNKWLPKYREEDSPAKLMSQIDWLKDLGFVNIDVIWKYYNFAVYGGSKPANVKQ